MAFELSFENKPSCAYLRVWLKLETSNHQLELHSTLEEICPEIIIVLYIWCLV